MTFQEARVFGEKRLAQSQIEDARWDARLLLEYVTGMKSSQYLLHQREPMPEEQKQEYEKLLEARCSHIPLQHLTGEQEFMGLPFSVNEHVLIPRQDTEVLVEQAGRELKPGMRILDLCTGSGCILLSLLSMVPEAVGCGTDISGDALRVAKANAHKLNVNAKFHESDLFEKVTGLYDIIVSNPPYIPTREIEGLMPEVRDYEPAGALDGGADGLNFYRRICREAVHYLKPGGQLYLEIGSDQGAVVCEMLEKEGYSGVAKVRDLSGLDRVVYGRMEE